MGIQSTQLIKTTYLDKDLIFYILLLKKSIKKIILIIIVLLKCTFGFSQYDVSTATAPDGTLLYSGAKYSGNLVGNWKREMGANEDLYNVKCGTMVVSCDGKTGTVIYLPPTGNCGFIVNAIKWRNFYTEESIVGQDRLQNNGQYNNSFFYFTSDGNKLYLLPTSMDGDQTIVIYDRVNY